MPPRIHLAALHKPSKSVWQTIVSTGPARRTTSGVTIRACSVLRLGGEEKPGIGRISVVKHMVVMVDPCGKAKYRGLQ